MNQKYTQQGHKDRVVAAGSSLQLGNIKKRNASHQCFTAITAAKGVDQVMIYFFHFFFPQEKEKNAAPSVTATLRNQRRRRLIPPHRQQAARPVVLF